jgi:hypothetical protein
MELTLPNGSVVLAQGRLGLVASRRPRSPDFAMYLDHRWFEDPDVTWPHRMIEWPDFGLPSDEAELFASVVDLHRRACTGELVEVACYGGIGRTGTVLGLLAVLDGLSGMEAVRWVRLHYHRSAIETEDQVQLVRGFARSRLLEEMPDVIRSALPPVPWNMEKLWALELPVEEVRLDDLIWMFDLPLWTWQGRRFQISPNDVIENPGTFDAHLDRAMTTDLAYPIHLFEHKGRWVVLDGYHRMLKAKLTGNSTLPARRLSSSDFEWVCS